MIYNSKKNAVTGKEISIFYEHAGGSMRSLDLLYSLSAKIFHPVLTEAVIVQSASHRPVTLVCKIDTTTAIAGNPQGNRL